MTYSYPNVNYRGQVFILEENNIRAKIVKVTLSSVFVFISSSKLKENLTELHII